MSRPPVMYHKDYAREGRMFDPDNFDQEALERDGWVINPKNMGHNVWEPGNPEIHETDNTNHR